MECRLRAEQILTQGEKDGEGREGDVRQADAG